MLDLHRQSSQFGRERPKAAPRDRLRPRPPSFLAGFCFSIGPSGPSGRLRLGTQGLNEITRPFSARKNGAPTQESEMTTANKSEKDRVIVFDTTLRDGEQCPGATMTFEEGSRSPKCSTTWASTSSRPVFRSPRKAIFRPSAKSPAARRMPSSRVYRAPTRRTYAHVRLIFGRSGSTETLSTDVGTWTFTMTHSDGWQVCGLQTPELCDTYLNCTHGAAPSGPSPSPSPSGLLSNLDPLQRCGPKDPFREYHDCPSPTP